MNVFGWLIDTIFWVVFNEWNLKICEKIEKTSKSNVYNLIENDKCYEGFLILINVGCMIWKNFN